jgi:hypothetical protein
MRREAILFALALAALSVPAAAKDGTEREGIAVFSLECSDLDVPPEAIGRADRAIRGIFSGLGRYRVIGMAQSLTAEEASALAEEITEARRGPGADRSPRRFGEAEFTEAEFGRLVKASLAAVPLMSALESSFDEAEARWETEVKAELLLFDLDSGGGALGLVEVEVSGFDEADRELSICRAIEALPLLLQSELGEGARLVELPRLGVDLEPYLRVLVGRPPDLAIDPRAELGASVLAGLRVPVARGFHGLRPYAAVQVPAAGVRGYGPAFVFPLDLLIGAEYRLGAGRFSLVPYCGAGIGFVYASETIRGGSADSSKSVAPHLGGQAYLHLALLASRDVRLFVELGGEYWKSTIADLYTDYGGVGLGAGVSIKL